MMWSEDRLWAEAYRSRYVTRCYYFFSQARRCVREIESSGRGHVICSCEGAARVERSMKPRMSIVWMLIFCGYDENYIGVLIAVDAICTTSVRSCIGRSHARGCLSPAAILYRVGSAPSLPGLSCHASMSRPERLMTAYCATF